MSDTKDAIGAAKAQNQRLAASCMVRKEALAADIATLDRQKASAAELARSSDPKTSMEATAILRTIEERLTEKQSELASADHDLKQALGEVRELEKLGGRAVAIDARVIAASALPGDPFVRSPEERALDNARSHIASLEAQTRLEHDMGVTEATTAAPLMTEAEARAKLEEMRAKLRSSSKASEATPSDTNSSGPNPSGTKPSDAKPSDTKPSDTRPKKTL